MTDDNDTKMFDFYRLAAVAYTRAADAFEEATKAYRAAVMAYDIASGDNEMSQFDPPETEQGQ
tara:strand:- start:156 stop:344 length:189 start_codon:yes stop_codon:yes gene_type:complete